MVVPSWQEQMGGAVEGGGEGGRVSETGERSEKYV